MTNVKGVSDGARELSIRPCGGRRRGRAGLALVESPAVLQTLDEAARDGPRWARSHGFLLSRSSRRAEAAELGPLAAMSTRLVACCSVAALYFSASGPRR